MLMELSCRTIQETVVTTPEARLRLMPARSRWLKIKVESADKPGSVMDNHSSGTTVTDSLKQPTRKRPRARHMLPYLVLLRMGFTLPRSVATRAVRSYRTISPLPSRSRAVYFLWHFPWARAPQALPGILPAGARTFLPLQAVSDCLADSAANISDNKAPKQAKQLCYTATRQLPSEQAVGTEQNKEADIRH